MVESFDPTNAASLLCCAKTSRCLHESTRTHSFDRKLLCLYTFRRGFSPTANNSAATHCVTRSLHRRNGRWDPRQVWCGVASCTRAIPQQRRRDAKPLRVDASPGLRRSFQPLDGGVEDGTIKHVHGHKLDARAHVMGHPVVRAPGDERKKHGEKHIQCVCGRAQSSHRRS